MKKDVTIFGIIVIIFILISVKTESTAIKFIPLFFIVPFITIYLTNLFYKKKLTKIPYNQYIKINEGCIFITKYEETERDDDGDLRTITEYDVQVIDNGKSEPKKYRIAVNNPFITNISQLENLIAKSQQISPDPKIAAETKSEKIEISSLSELTKHFVDSIKTSSIEGLNQHNEPKTYQLELYLNGHIWLVGGDNPILNNKKLAHSFFLIEVEYLGEKLYSLLSKVKQIEQVKTQTNEQTGITIKLSKKVTAHLFIILFLFIFIVGYAYYNVLFK